MNLLTKLAVALGSRRLRIGSKGIRPTKEMRRSILGLTSFCPQSDKDDNLPRSYPGAKLARKAAQGKLGVRH